MSDLNSRAVRAIRGASAGWERFWFSEIPPHIYALLRILLGIVACASLLGLSDLAAFWDLDGFVPLGDKGLGFKSWLVLHTAGHIEGRVLFFTCLTAYALMAIGFRTSLTVALSLAASIAQLFWNHLPLSAAHAALQSGLFCLVWAECGSVWSLDAWLSRTAESRHPTPDPGRCSLAPLRLIRFQIALIYLSSGLWKLSNPLWRDGSAVHYVVNANVYQRFPYELPTALASFTTLLTYAVLFWELAFALMILWRPTRRVALIAGVLIHVGMTAAIEIGPFPWVMLSGYAAFFDPEVVRDLPGRVRQCLQRRNRKGTLKREATTLAPNA